VAGAVCASGGTATAIAAGGLPSSRGIKESESVEGRKAILEQRDVDSPKDFGTEQSSFMQRRPDTNHCSIING